MTHRIFTDVLVILLSAACGNTEPESFVTHMNEMK